MGWTNSHLHRFRTDSDHRSPYFVTSYDLDEGEDGTLEDDARLDQLLAEKVDELWYEYDFGDGWDHKLVIEEVLDEPHSLTANLMAGGRPRDGGPYVAQVMALVNSGDPTEVVSALQPLAETAPLLAQDVRVQRYQHVMSVPKGPQHGRGEPVSGSILVDHFTPELSRDVETLLSSGTVGAFSVRPVGGAVADVPDDATAYVGRRVYVAVVALGSQDPALDTAWRPVERHAVGSYLSFESQLNAQRLRLAFPPAALKRLRTTKERVDFSGLDAN